MASTPSSLSTEQLIALAKLASQGIDVSHLLPKLEVGSSSQTSLALPPPSPVSTKTNPVSMETDEECMIIEPQTEETPEADIPATNESGSRKRTRSVSKASAPRRSTRAKKQVDLRVDSPVEDDGRTIVSDLVLEQDFLKENRLIEVASLLKTQGWNHLFEEQVTVDESLLKEFYEHFSLDEKPGLLIATFKIKGEDYSVTSRELALYLNVPHRGYGEYVKGQWPSSVAQEEVLGRVGKDVKSMGLVTRVVSQGVTPRLQKHNIMNFQDYLLVDKILLGKQVNLPMQVLQHMNHSALSPKHGLPYPGVIKKILDRFGLYDPSDEIAAYTKFDVENCSRLGFKFDPEEGWVHKVETQALQSKEVHVAPVMDVTPVMDILKTLVEKVEKLTAEVVSLTEKVSTLESSQKRIEESVDIGLVHQTETKEQLKELNKQLHKVATGALTELKRIVRR